MDKFSMTKLGPDHIHTPHDGGGARDVFVDGRKVDGAFYADTKRGIVDYYPKPLKIHKRGKRVITRRLRGHVEVVRKSDG
ncbi:hypothetical protein [Halomonas caseinilytica]|uniref:Uncharacterized protein n=1 Tax=Halomonas caseinilytica TaxID=438744 RepID=A0A1M6UHC3_9GAMM|nr:hypothetical protein [Halomonas caseinilytica]SHK68561.1 hypothetical protein SAMN05192556_104265 [Halomonas caseinilytica]